MDDIPQYRTKTELPRFKAQDSLDDETEDEEVKLNCIGGLRGYQESDLSSDSGEEDEEQGDELEMEERNSMYVLLPSGFPADEPVTLRLILTTFLVP